MCNLLETRPEEKYCMWLIYFRHFLVFGRLLCCGIYEPKKALLYPAPVGGFLLMGAYIAIGFLP